MIAFIVSIMGLLPLQCRRWYPRMLRYFVFIWMIGGSFQALAISPSVVANEIVWHDARKFTIEGKGWDRNEKTFDRLPLSAKAAVSPAIWTLSRHSAGVYVLFRADCTRIKLRWSVKFDNSHGHMPATAVKGLDLYVRGENGWRWAAVAIPKQKDNEVDMISNMPPGQKDFLLYLPLYDGIDSLAIGVEKNTQIQPLTMDYQSKPLFFYGTSITQGASASRPGMAYPAIIGRTLNREAVNLGFSGNGKMDEGIYQLLAEVDASMLVIDCLPNMAADVIRQKTMDLVKGIRMKSPQTPILLVENISYTHAWLNENLRRLQANKNKELKQAFDDLQKAGVKNLFYLESRELAAAGGEGAIDGVHLTDLGFQHLAGVLAGKILEVETGLISNK